jgi:aspartate/methionine/tyrosine aminotransferase
MTATASIAAARLSHRVQAIEPFYVMEMAKAAQALAARTAGSDKPVVFLNIGEPDFTAAPDVVRAAQAALAEGHTQYTDAKGLWPLRQAIARWYGQHFALAVDPERIVVTAGASAALQLATLALINPGDEVLMPDPSYPCNRHFVTAAGGVARLLPTGPAARYHLSLAQVQAAWNDKTRAVLLASPSNPTGTSMDPEELRRIIDFVHQQGGVCLMDEIYLALCYDARYSQSALAVSERVVSINSFSKYFNMTGWRLGWLVLPPELVAPVERLAQNLYICPSTLAQHAALACFTPESLALFETRRAAFMARRDAVIPKLAAMGLGVPVVPDGAFYAWVDVRDWCQRLGLPGSWELAQHILEHAHVAVTPGRDFGPHAAQQHIRLSLANSDEQLDLALRRLAALL